MSKHVRDILRRGQRGFTLIELVAVMAILAILAGLVGGAVGGLGASGQSARLAGDADTIGKAADRFFNDAFPQVYPITKPASLMPGPGDLGVGILDWDARLPQDPRKTFVPDFVKEIPESAALVSWRLDERTASVFYAREGALLIPPSQGRMNVSVSNTTASTVAAPVRPNLSFNFMVNKNEAAAETMKIQIPAGYTVNPLGIGTRLDIGDVGVAISTDNPWNPGNAFQATGNVFATGQAGMWEIVINFVLPHPVMTVTHPVTIREATPEVPGEAVIQLQRVAGAPDYNPASMDFTITIYGTAISGITTHNIILNPSVAAVYRWLTKEHATIDVKDVFQAVAGNQSVVIK